MPFVRNPGDSIDAISGAYFLRVNREPAILAAFEWNPGRMFLIRSV
jgi:hypothetical protein